MQCIRRNECFRIARPERIIRRTGFGKQPKNSIPLNTKGILNGCPLYFHRPATRQNSTDHRGTIRTFVPLSTASPRQDGNKFALHPLIRIFPKYSNAATLKKIWLRRLVVLSLQKTGSDSAIFACKPARLLSSLYYL